ncbi:MAG: GDSL-type esterase/lipase family protein [Pseudomonadota bacterium]
MNILKFLIFTCCFLFYTSQAVAQFVTSSSQQLLVVIYGDVLTSNSYLPVEQTFPHQLEKRLRTIGFDVSVLAMGETEFTTPAALEKLPNLIGISPDLVIVQLGETDLKREFSAIGITSNIKKIVDSLQKKGVYVIVMAPKMPTTSDAEYNKKIVDFFTKIGKTVPLYPYTLQDIAGNSERTISDNYLPNSNGVEVMVNGIYIAVDTGLRWRLDVINKLRLQKQKKHSK